MPQTHTALPNSLPPDVRPRETGTKLPREAEKTMVSRASNYLWKCSRRSPYMGTVGTLSELRKQPSATYKREMGMELDWLPSHRLDGTGPCYSASSECLLASPLTQKHRHFSHYNCDPIHSQREAAPDRAVGHT